MFEYMHPADKPVFEGLEEIEVVFAKDQPQYNPLRTLRSEAPTGSVFSRWSPTEEQREAIAEGADIVLELMTFHGPLQPIRVIVTAGKLDTDWVRVCLLDMPAIQGTKSADDQVPVSVNEVSQ